ncbi:hypothetical protein [Treponema sp. Marseille-Q3903]|uniref:hypothetical protein n=1 Tax=Treponema sp. Marseille-Q3903 TaxID=2766703 RepID=UPI00165251C2|nr:hypothetical protein [Treponema sp. Marseille-Q3903]MBC6712440.1 hypothetical protein [Treponema sp. Marseille-Q3903]
MKKVWEVIKKIFVWLGAVFVAIFTVLFVKEMPKQVRHDDVEDDTDEINTKAAAKRDQAIARIERADARELAESYGSVSMQLPTEKKDSENAARELTIEEVMQIAEEEIERTAQEAVKSALLETGGELAFEKERADQLEKQKLALALELENKKLKEAAEKKKNQFFYGALIGGTGGVVITSLVFGIIGGLIK